MGMSMYYEDLARPMSRPVFVGLVLVTALAAATLGVWSPVGGEVGVGHSVRSVGPAASSPSFVSGSAVSGHSLVPPGGNTSGPGRYSVTFTFNNSPSPPTSRVAGPAEHLPSPGGHGDICIGCGSYTTCSSYTGQVSSWWVCCTVTYTWWDSGFGDYSVSCVAYAQSAAFAGQPSYSDSNITTTTTNSSVTFSGPNGTYWYLVHGQSGELVSGMAPDGNISVAGTNVSETVNFVPGKTVGIQYSEKGLVPGTAWCTGLLGYCSTTSTLSWGNMELTPGTYPVWLAPVAGYTASAQVNGHKLDSLAWVTLSKPLTTIAVKFAPVVYPVAFNETGLAPGVAWSIKVACTDSLYNTSGCDGMKASGKDVASSTGGAIDVQLRNGTYSWSVKPIKGYELEVGGAIDPTWSGTFTVAAARGANSLNIYFQR